MISQQLGCYRAVIFAGNQNIFISHLPAGITDISFSSLDDVLKRKTFVDRHQLGSELRLGCVQRNCQIDRQSQLRQLFDTWDNTAGRNRHVPVTHIQRIFLMQELQCADNGVKIKHRFAAAHNDNTTDLLTFSDQHTVKNINLC